MPKVKPLAREDPRASAIRAEIGALMGEMRLTQGELAKKSGIPPSTLSLRLSKDGIGSMKLSEYWALQDVLKRYRGFGV